MTETKEKLSIKAIIQIIVYILLMPFLPLLVSQKWDWWEAWVFAAVYILNYIISRLLVAKVHPDLIQERGKFLQHKNNQPWDNILAPLVAVGVNLVPLAAGLQAYYNRLSPFSLPIEILALLLYLGGFVWGSYALLENRFFSGTVRLQTERGHHVVSSGPYSIMRHPGYAGALVSYLALPLFFGSLWAFFPVIFFVIVLVIRTSLEDRFLQEQLPGYAEYAHKVPWRLVPGIW